MPKLSKLAAIITATVLSMPAWAAELVMVEETGCFWCKRWEAEIGVAYPKTAEGKFAPLRKVELGAIPKDIEIARRVNFTPTFLLVEDGKELARIEGHPGEDFFWPLLEQMLLENTDYQKAPAAGG